jgi:hypothetical protein
MKLASSADGAVATETWANRDPRQYECVGDENDAARLHHIIDVLLLKRDSAWPGTGAAASQLAEWGVMGISMLAHDATGEKADRLDAALLAGVKSKKKRKLRKKPGGAQSYGPWWDSAKEVAERREEHAAFPCPASGGRWRATSCPMDGWALG